MRASSTATTCVAPSRWRASSATASKVSTASTGTPAPNASPCATEQAVRRPVKEPGPRPNTMASRSRQAPGRPAPAGPGSRGSARPKPARRPAPVCSSGACDAGRTALHGDGQDFGAGIEGEQVQANGFRRNPPLSREARIIAACCCSALPCLPGCLPLAALPALAQAPAAGSRRGAGARQAAARRGQRCWWWMPTASRAPRLSHRAGVPVNPASSPSWRPPSRRWSCWGRRSPGPRRFTSTAACGTARCTATCTSRARATPSWWSSGCGCCCAACRGWAYARSTGDIVLDRSAFETCRARPRRFRRRAAAALQRGARCVAAELQVGGA